MGAVIVLDASESAQYQQQRDGWEVCERCHSYHSEVTIDDDCVITSVTPKGCCVEGRTPAPVYVVIEGDEEWANDFPDATVGFVLPSRWRLSAGETTELRGVCPEPFRRHIPPCPTCNNDGSVLLAAAVTVEVHAIADVSCSAPDCEPQHITAELDDGTGVWFTPDQDVVAGRDFVAVIRP